MDIKISENILNGFRVFLTEFKENLTCKHYTNATTQSRKKTCDKSVFLA